MNAITPSTETATTQGIQAMKVGVIYTNDCSGDKFIVRRCNTWDEAFGWMDYYVRDGQYHECDLNVADL